MIEDELGKIRKKLDEMEEIEVKIALFGQPGAGKSSLINKIIGNKAAEVGVETDKTVELTWYEYNGLKFADLPGYGTKNFPKESYFDEFDMEQFDLFLCVTSGKFHQADTEFFQQLKEIGKVCLFIVNKHDELWEDDVTIEELEQRKQDDIYKQVNQDVEVIFTSCRKNTGIDKLNKAIENSLDDAKCERYQRSAKAYSLEFLDKKRKVCERHVALAASAAAANGINPIPGVDISVDVGIIVGLFKAIRDDYGLNDKELVSLTQSAGPIAMKTANYILEFATKQGVLIILKNYAIGETAKTITKYIPFVGQAIAAGIGYLIVSNAGKDYHDKCYELAEQILKNKLNR